MYRAKTASVLLDRRRPGSRRRGLFAVAWVCGVVWSVAGACAQETPAAHPPPRFVEVWFGGPLDSIYNAEYQRLQAVCSGQGDACYREELDTTAVALTPVWPTADADIPVGRLVARLRTEGRWPRAALIFQGSDGVETTVRENLGDWGYGTTLALRDVRNGRLQPWLLSPVGGYKILAVEGGRVRLRPEIPADMACEPGDTASTTEPGPIHDVPLAQLLDSSGRPTVEVAYPKGC